MTLAVNQPSAATADDWFTPGRFLVLMAMCLFAAFPEVVLGSHTFYYRDFGHFAYPLAHYHRECFWRGEIPLWNPYNSCGLPHLAQWNTMCLYPGALIYLLGPMPWALGWFSLAHLLLAGAGAYRLAHHWTGNRFAASVAGLAFAFNGFTLHAVMWPNNVAALAWAPWLWLLVERACKEGGRTVLLAALVGAMQMLAGAPEVILFTWAIAAAFVLLECLKRETENVSQVPLTHYALRFTSLALLVTLLSAAQLLPFLDLLRHSHRTAGFDDNLYAMPLWGWANFFVPLFRMTPDRLGVFTHLDQQWTSSYYPGIGILALAALAVWRRREPRVWLLAVVALLGVWLAMGHNAFLLDWLKALCPPLGFIRFPIKYVLLPLMVLPFLAAMALAERRSPTRHVHSLAPAGGEGRGEGKNPTTTEAETAVAEPAVARNHSYLIALRDFGVIGGGFLFCIYFIVEPEFRSSLHSLGADSDSLDLAMRVTVSACLQVFSLGLVFAAWIFIERVTSKTASIIARLVLLAVIAFNILTHAPRQNPTVITQAYEPGVAKFSTAMPRLGEGRAMVSREMEGFMAHAHNPDALNYCIGARRALFANWNLLDGVPKANGFFSQFPRELSDTWWLLYGHDRPFPERFADFLGITRISSSETLFTWTHRTNALPLVTAGMEPVFTDATNTLRELVDTGYDPAGIVFLPKELLAISRATNASAITRATVLSTRWARESLSIEVEANAPVWVVIAQTYYHPWKAFEGERELPIRRANHAFQAIEVSAGRHTIELRYVDHAFRLGAAFSLTTLALVLFGLLRARRPLITEH
ncbi:MAG: hypothetical protein FD161_2080 [Limisphaerales bacterium]|nr:MAG: hypothetical protein FD161_2080 [Limisphaerales bacterium]KAG0508985.1 MAG: hypothetical protein E1N63_1882 [Limisphaerales bacterium]TXT51294.1 MAG: hypothetical protein FD140_1753 [Limisphaerales bacterium]